jgi:hypothetical protein
MNARPATVVVVVCGMAVLCGCSNDLTPVDAQRTATCLQRAGQPTRRIDLARASQRAWGDLPRAEGRTVALSVRDPRRKPRRPWGFLFYFDGAKKARKAQDAYRTLPAAVRLSSTRRQNVLVLFGRSGRGGVAPTPAQKRRLQACFDEATS